MTSRRKSHLVRRRPARVVPRTRRGGRMVTRIVVPVDFSHGSLKAIPYALAISRQFNADLHFVHVVERGENPLSTRWVMPPESRADFKKQLYRRLETLASKYTGEADRFTVHVPFGARPYKELCRVARQLNADLIVIATHGFAGYKHAFLGSTAERIIQFSPCPVLVVRRRLSKAFRRNGDAAPGFRARRIIIPIDFSTCSQTAFDLGTALASDFGADVILLHAADTARPMGDPTIATAAATLIKHSEDEALKRLQEMARETKLCGSVEIARGSPCVAICNAASMEDADLIVISTHGRSGLKHVLLGSVAERVVRYANCPVLVIPRNWAAVKPSRKSHRTKGQL